MYSGSGDDIGAVVADIGSYSTRIGFAGDDFPKAYFPSTAGSTMSTEIGIENSSKKQYHFDITQYRENMMLENVFRDGIISDWDVFENIWDHAISNYLKVEMKETPIILAEKPYNPPASRRKTTEIMFEKMNVPAFFLSKDAVLSCFSCGRTSGMVIDIGSASTVISPVCDGWVEPRGINRSVVGGRALDAYMQSLLMQSQQGNALKPLFRLLKTLSPDGITIQSKLKELGVVHPTYDAFMSLEIARDVKETVCRIADTPIIESEIKFSSVPTSMYELPDGQILDLGIERFRVPELLFDNTALDYEYPDLTTLGYSVLASPGVHGSLPFSRENIPNLIVDATLRCDNEVQSTLLSNIVLTGGSSCYDGIPERMKLEVEKIMQPISPGWRVKVMASGMSERPICAWLGGSILASLGSFHEMWLTKQEYEEFGSALIDRKCP
eukprot:gene12148-25496_t